MSGRAESEVLVYSDADAKEAREPRSLWRRGLTLEMLCWLMRQRIRTKLEFHELALSTFAAFNVPHKVSAVVRIQRTAFPSGADIVDAGVQSARIEPQRIRNAEVGPLFRLRAERN